LIGELLPMDMSQGRRRVAALIDGQSTLKTFLVKNGKPS
jgi:hypothetical protein